MEQIPDAPWIREAEMYGYPEGPDIDPVCPVCGKECESIYIDTAGKVCGCDRCIERLEAYDWALEVWENEKAG